ncbi:MAG: ATP-binding protein, partial [Duodenibacillus sp.]
QVQVIDNGQGVDESIREKIFYPLVTGRDNGTGLGLSIVQTYVEQHGGSIDVDSQPGRTVFSLLFPLSKPQ